MGSLMGYGIVTAAPAIYTICTVVAQNLPDRVRVQIVQLIDGEYSIALLYATGPTRKEIIGLSHFKS